MAKYFTAQVCKNGHSITRSIELYPNEMQNFCSKCGAETITSCPSCNTLLRGELYDEEDLFICNDISLDSYCPNCGNPYPWTQSAIENAILMIQEEEGLSYQFKESVIQSLPDIIVETPKTGLAVIRLKKCMSTVGKFAADGLRQFVVDFGCEFAKNLLGL